MAKKRPFNLVSYLRSVLRKASYRHPQRSEAMRQARVAYGTYRCAVCGKNKKPKEVAVDHVTPVVPITGWDSWDGFISRLFCDAEGLQVICRTPCHEEKTKKERELRKKHVGKDKRKVGRN